MASSFSNNNTPITLNLQDKSYKIPVSTNVPIELTPGSLVLRKTPTKEEITSNNYSYIQHQIDLLKQELENNKFHILKEHRKNTNKSQIK